jgi:RNA polymerase sigma factor (sigma-70 family)
LTNSRTARHSLVARLAAGSLPAEPPDAALAASVQGTKGQNPVDDLVANHADAVYRYALRLTRNTQQAEDLTQETLLRGWKQRAKLREAAAARVWLLRIATNVHRDGIRAARPCVNLPAELAETTQRGATRRTEQRECVERALAALDDLPARQRQVMHLITIEQLNHEDAAAVLEISVEALKASLSLARHAMREKLKDIYDDVRGARR